MEDYAGKLEKKKNDIKKYLGCFAKSKNKPNYQELLDSVQFIYCRPRIESNVTDFIRLTDKLITAKSKIKKIVLNKDRNYLVYFTENNYRVKSTYYLAQRLIDELGLVVEVE